MAPLVLIAANPYEGALCKKALADTGLSLEPIESIDGAMVRIAAETPLVVVIADGWQEADARELLVEIRSAHEQLPIFLIEPPGSDIADEEAAIRRGASRLFLRPIDVEVLADAIEKLAVEAELASEVSEQIESQREEADLQSGPSLEMEALADDEWDLPERQVVVGRIELQKIQRVPTEVVALPAVPGTPTTPTIVDPPTERLPSLGAPPPTVTLSVQDHLLRADDALADAAGLRIQSLASNPDFVVRVSDVPLPEAVAESPRVPAPVAHDPAHDELRRQAFADRSTFARRLDKELSEAERRLFPDSAPSSGEAGRIYADYDDALGDIDLDSLGLDTVPGLAADRLEATVERRQHSDGNGARAADESPEHHPERHEEEPLGLIPRESTSPLLRLAGETDLPRAGADAALPLEEEGSLADHDVAELLCSLGAIGWTGRLQLTRGDGEKTLYFDAGVPVFATSTFVHDRLGDLLWREGKLTREQHGRTRELASEPGRRTAALLVELGLLKSRELFPTLRRHVEEILYSCFSWDSGRYRLGPEQAPAPSEDRLRLSQGAWALFVEGIRRKYGLERLAELVGPPETVLLPTTTLERALHESNLSSSERVAAELFDGERSLADVQLALSGLPGVALAESALYALAWGLLCLGAARLEDDPTDRIGVPSVSTLVTPLSSAMRERRKQARDGDGARPENDRAGDRAIDRDRVMAKRAQVGDADYFAVLGIDRHASPHEIERAFQRLRLDFAPDRFGEGVQAELGHALLEINQVLDEAHRVLMDEAVRHSYRENLVDG